MEKVKILFLAVAYPSNAQLKQVREVKEIYEVLRQSKYRNQLKLEYKPVTELSDLQKYILEEKPQIVHFSSHGGNGELFLTSYYQKEDGELVSTRRVVPVDFLEKVFGQVKEYVNCVVLSSCHSEKQAKKIAENVPYVIGTTKNILDNNATEFAKEFYRNVGDGEDLAYAFKQALINAAGNLRAQFNESDFISLTKADVKDLILLPISLASDFLANLEDAQLQDKEREEHAVGKIPLVGESTVDIEYRYDIRLKNLSVELYQNFVEDSRYIQKYKLKGRWFSQELYKQVFFNRVQVDRPWGSNKKADGNFTIHIETIDGILSEIQIDVNRYNDSANNYAANKVEQLIESKIKEAVRRTRSLTLS